MVIESVGGKLIIGNPKTHTLGKFNTSPKIPTPWKTTTYGTGNHRY